MSQQAKPAEDGDSIDGDPDAPGFERGWPFSMIALLSDLRYQMASEGVARGYYAWVAGQAKRTGEIYEAAKVEGPEVARANSRSGGWGWNPFWGWRYRMGWRVPTSVGVFFAFVGFYFRLFFTALFALPVLALMTVMVVLMIPAGLINGEPVAAGLAAVMACLGVAFYGWLLTGNADDDAAGGSSATESGS